HQPRFEDPFVHRSQIARYDGPEPHFRDDVAFGIDSRRDFDELEAAGCDPEDGPLRHEQRHLSALPSHARVVANLLELRHELLMASFVTDDGLAGLPRDVEIAGRQRAAEDHALRVLADIDEAADADDLVAESAHVDVALG